MGEQLYQDRNCVPCVCSWQVSCLAVLVCSRSCEAITTTDFGPAATGSPLRPSGVVCSGHSGDRVTHNVDFGDWLLSLSGTFLRFTPIAAHVGASLLSWPENLPPCVSTLLCVSCTTCVHVPCVHPCAVCAATCHVCHAPRASVYRLRDLGVVCREQSCRGHACAGRHVAAWPYLLGASGKGLQ